MQWYRKIMVSERDCSHSGLWIILSVLSLLLSIYRHFEQDDYSLVPAYSFGSFSLFVIIKQLFLKGCIARVLTFFKIWQIPIYIYSTEYLNIIIKKKTVTNSFVCCVWIRNDVPRNLCIDKPCTDVWCYIVSHCLHGFNPLPIYQRLTMRSAEAMLDTEKKRNVLLIARWWISVLSNP